MTIEQKIGFATLTAIAILIETFLAIIIFNDHGEYSFYVWMIGSVSADVVFLGLTLGLFKDDH